MSDVRRPIGVTLIGVVIILNGLLGLIAGILGLFNRDETIPIWVPIVLIAISIIYIVIARGLFSGSNGARMVVGLLSLLSLIMGVWSLLFMSGLRIQGLIQALIAIIILMVLFGPRAKAFFR